jgi:hypothetical protein
MRKLFLVIGMAVSLPSYAQLTAPVKTGDTTITVTGIRESKVEMSDWRMAETPHVVVFSQNDEKELRVTAHNLEKLHFLLSTLFGRVDAPDETIKIAVTMIGHVGAFEQLRLSDLRWQYGPFPWKFAKTVYYDPREEGSVIATTKDGVRVILRPSLGRLTNRNCYGTGDRSLNNPTVTYRVDGGSGTESFDVDAFLMSLPINELVFCQSAESRLYAAFAQNYLLTYFPAPYPRWFLQGFGEIFATMASGDDFVEYGHLPPGFQQVMEFYKYNGYPVVEILDGRYLSGKARVWTPHHAWRLVHLLYFSDEWKPRLHQYLGAIARGADPQSAAGLLGDPAQLQSAVNAYRGRKVQFERMTFPADRAPEPTVRQMTRAEAGLIRGRLELGARIEVPAEDSPERTTALERRSAWLDQLRANAGKFPNLIEHQLLLAEAECRSGNPEACLDAAERALRQSRRDTTALVWKGTALAQLAARAPAAERKRRLGEARKVIAQANRLDTDGILPLIAFYNSFAVAGEPAPDNAVDGLAKIVQSSPAAPSPRLKLGEEFIKRDLDEAARHMLLPVAKGAFETPEKPAAAALLPQD